MNECDIAVIGGGPAGLAAAAAASKMFNKIRKDTSVKIIIFERDTRLGGILNQCIHNGFGLHHFGEELTGPEYALRFIDEVKQAEIECKTDTMVLDITNRIITSISVAEGLTQVRAGAVILAMGCRERTRGALVIPGTRPAGIFTAGAVQRFVNIDGYLPGRKVVILGSGDIGLIMARRLTLEGAEVKMICELMPFSAGLTRNIVQCVENFNIPLRFSHTITEIHGKHRVEGVSIAQVDKNRKPVPGTEEYISCDTLVLSVGLIPENELSIAAGVHIDSSTSGPSVNNLMETSQEGVFACGNAVHVHDLVDFVTAESVRAGENAAVYVCSQTGGHEEQHKNPERKIMIKPGNRVRYTVPQYIDLSCGAFDFASDGCEKLKNVSILFRTTDVYRDVQIVVYSSSTRLKTVKKKIVKPGEMQTVELTAALLDKITGDVTVAVEIPEEDVD